jgi:hypothetical protein
MAQIKLQENIQRIKELMLVENDEQLSLFVDESDPVSINDNVFTKRFKEKVYFILRDLYKSNWDKDNSRGPGGGGGVVNVHTVYDLLQKKGLTDYDPQGGDWSILNYFDTNPKVRETIVGLYETETGNVLNNTNIMEDFITWMSKNRNKLFKDGPILNQLIEKNIESLYSGELNERKAYDYLTEVLKNLDGWSLKGRSVPGSKTDREGVDFVMVNEKTGKEGKFQVKPLTFFVKTKNGYKVKSYNISGLDKKPVDYFVFASKDKDDVFIFRNTKNKYVILDKNTVHFEEPPIKF